jgi:hypothetical protein
VGRNFLDCKSTTKVTKINTPRKLPAIRKYAIECVLKGRPCEDKGESGIDYWGKVKQAPQLSLIREDRCTHVCTCMHCTCVCVCSDTASTCSLYMRMHVIIAVKIMNVGWLLINPICSSPINALLAQRDQKTRKDKHQYTRVIPKTTKLYSLGARAT